MSEHEGALRVATTHEAWGRAAEVTGAARVQQSSSNLAVLVERGGRLVERGRVDGLGVGERIQAVRYFGELAAVVTFRQTDPLYLLDLSDETAPQELGELKVPGFSSTCTRWATVCCSASARTPTSTAGRRGCCCRSSTSATSAGRGR